MKLQNLIIIFIIILIPIIFIFSLYLKLENRTIVMQTSYDEKLIEAAKEAMEAFEINTTEWNSEYSSLANSKRQDLMASVNVFSSSLADKLGVSGSSTEVMLSYVPAMVYVMYDGYYIYTPTYVPQTITNNNGVQLFYYANVGYDGTRITSSATQNIRGTIQSGEPIYYAKTGEGTLGTYNGEEIYYTTDVTKAEKTYKHVLKTFVPYTKNYEFNGDDYVVNFTLDDYIRVYGNGQSKEGYIIKGFGTTYIIYMSTNSITGMRVNGHLVTVEKLTENIYVKENSTSPAQLRNYPYIYNSNNDKRYYDETTGRFFTLNSSNVKVYLANTIVGESLSEYKKLSICLNNATGEYVELYQLINGNDDKWYYRDMNNQYVEFAYQPSVNKAEDCSAINYYIETYYFNMWLRSSNGLDLDEDEIEQLLNEKNQAIIDNINNNLNLSISNYRANSSIDYEIPELTDSDWEQALSNISLIAFFQGQKIGLKTYNNYAIVTSTENNEFVSEDSLYYIGRSTDTYYHRYNCARGAPDTYQAYRNTEFKVQQYEENGVMKYYYKHYGASGKISQCFDCIVNRNNYQTSTNDEDLAYYSRTLYTALARERYIQIQRNRLIEIGRTVSIPDIQESNIIVTKTPNVMTNQNVEVTIQSLVAEYILQYSFDTQNWRNYTTPIVMTQNGTIYIRLANAIGEGGIYISTDVDNIDKAAPYNFTPTTTSTTNSITIQGVTQDVPATATNACSGIRAYEFSIDNGATWVGGTAASNYTFTGLSQGTTYYLRMRAIDYAGNVTTTGTITAQTRTVTALNSGNTTINYYPTYWTNGSVQVSISTTVTGYTLQYSFDGSNWANYTGQITKTSNGPVYARVVDNAGQAGSGTYRRDITNIDKSAPNSFTPSISMTTNSITIRGSTTDVGGSGIRGYYFSINNGSTWVGLTSATSHTFTGLEPGTTYYLKMRAVDNAGNIRTTSTYAVQTQVTVPVFTYTGRYEIVNDDDTPYTPGNRNWKIRFLSSGTLTWNSSNRNIKIDVFLVGGGGGGARTGDGFNAGGGGSGYTRTIRNITLSRTSYYIVIGLGGAGSAKGGASDAGDGGTTSAFGYNAAGGNGAGGGGYSFGAAKGGDGGSGGGSGCGDSDVGNHDKGGPGGSNGSNGYATQGEGAVGLGQICKPGPNGETGNTREFGESWGRLYAGGGGGSPGMGRWGDSGAGGQAANTGGGGNTQYPKGQDGFSGIVVIRNAR